MGWLAKFFKGSDYLVPALDIGTYSLKLVQSERKGNNYRVKIFGQREYREQVFAGSDIIDEFELIDTIKELYRDLSIKEKEVIIHVPLSACFYSVISIPSSKNPEEAVIDYMKSIINPEEFSLVNIDYKVLPVSVEKGNVDIAIAAVRKDYLETRIRLLQESGLVPSVIDIEPAAINNQFYLNNPDKTVSPVCLVDIGASFTKVVVSFGGYPYITRNVEIGGQAINEQLQKEFMLSSKDVELLKRGETVKDVTYDEAFEVIKKVLRKIATEIMWTVDNFKDRFNLDVHSIYLYGGSSKLKGIVDFLGELSGLEVNRGNPLGFSGIFGNEEFAVASGLSIRYKGDENAKV